MCVRVFKDNTVCVRLPDRYDGITRMHTNGSNNMITEIQCLEGNTHLCIYVYRYICMILYWKRDAYNIYYINKYVRGCVSTLFQQ